MTIFRWVQPRRAWYAVVGAHSRVVAVEPSRAFAERAVKSYEAHEEYGGPYRVEEVYLARGE